MGEDMFCNLFPRWLRVFNRTPGVPPDYLYLDGFCLPVGWRIAVEDDIDHLGDYYILQLPSL